MKIDKDDKLISGILAGLAGSIVKDLLTAVVEYFKLRPSYWDYGEYLLFQNIDISTGTSISGIGMELLFGIALAIIYAHTKHLVRSKHELLKGCIFGVLIWFGSRAMITLTQTKILIPTSLILMPINQLIAIIYGIVVAYVLKKIEN